MTGGACGQECGGCSKPSAAPAPHLAPTVCAKCKQAELPPGEALCPDCLHNAVRSKFRQALRAGSMLEAGDAVALAFTGGSASAALLHLALASRAGQVDRPERSKVAFTLTVLHVDESAAAAAVGNVPAAEAVEAAAAPHLGEGVQYRCLPLHQVFEADEDEGRRAECLAQLLKAVPDPTGREDLVRHLRTRLLLSTAQAAGCTKLLLGDTGTRVATQIIAAAAKGRGYALPADIQWVDARYGPGQPVVMRPLLALHTREVESLCRLLHIPLASPPPPAGAGGGGSSGGGSARSIHSLAEAFVSGLYAHNPSTVGNILGVASKLQDFPWNQPAKGAQKKGRRDDRMQQAPTEEALDAGDVADAPDTLCSLCLSPMAPDELPGDSSSGATPGGACRSCWDLILAEATPSGGGAQTGGAVAGLLPREFLERGARGSEASSAGVDRLRDQISEYLLDDSG